MTEVPQSTPLLTLSEDWVIGKEVASCQDLLHVYPLVSIVEDCVD